METRTDYPTPYPGKGKMRKSFTSVKGKEDVSSNGENETKTESSQRSRCSVVGKTANEVVTSGKVKIFNSRKPLTNLRESNTGKTVNHKGASPNSGKSKARSLKKHLSVSFQETPITIKTPPAREAPLRLRAYETSSTKSGKSINNRLKCSSYWLAHIKLAESEGMHRLIIGFFNLALISNAELAKSLRNMLKSYTLKHNLLSYGDAAREVLQEYGLLDEITRINKEAEIISTSKPTVEVDNILGSNNKVSSTPLPSMAVQPPESFSTAESEINSKLSQETTEHANQEIYPETVAAHQSNSSNKDFLEDNDKDHGKKESAEAVPEKSSSAESCIAAIIPEKCSPLNRAVSEHKAESKAQSNGSNLANATLPQCRGRKTGKLGVRSGASKTNLPQPDTAKEDNNKIPRRKNIRAKTKTSPDINADKQSDIPNAMTSLKVDKEFPNEAVASNSSDVQTMSVDTLMEHVVSGIMSSTDANSVASEQTIKNSTSNSEGEKAVAVVSRRKRVGAFNPDKSIQEDKQQSSGAKGKTVSSKLQSKEEKGKDMAVDAETQDNALKKPQRKTRERPPVPGPARRSHRLIGQTKN